MTRKLTSEWRHVLPSDIIRISDTLVQFTPLLGDSIFKMDLMLDRSVYRDCSVIRDHRPSMGGQWYIHERGHGDLHWITEPTLLSAQVRYPASKKLDAHNRFADEITVGDFVRCSGSRDKDSWRKIIAIHDFSIMGTKYWEPIDHPDYATGTGSNNYICTIIEHRKASECVNASR